MMLLGHCLDDLLEIGESQLFIVDKGVIVKSANCCLVNLYSSLKCFSLSLFVII